MSIAKGSATGTASSAELLAAGEERDYVTIVLTNAIPLTIGVGAAAAAGSGIVLTKQGEGVRLGGNLARRQINIIGNGATVQYQVGELEMFGGGGGNGGYGDKTNITITLASLANAGKRQSAGVSIDGEFKDVLVGGFIKTGASGPGAGDYCDLYVAASADGGTTYSGEASGADAAYAGTIANVQHLGRISTVAAATTYEFGPFSIAAAFGGVLPKNWALIFGNESDGTLDTTGSNHEIHYHGVR
jgi:hypothetical protein